MRSSTASQTYAIAAGDDMRFTSLRIVQALCELCDIKTPTVVVFFATPFCPHNTLKREVPEERHGCLPKWRRLPQNLRRRAGKK